MLYLAGISISFFLSLLLFSKKDKCLADKILACWLAVVGLHLFLFYAFFSDKIFSYPWLLGVHIPLPLLHGPFLYLYAAAVSGQLKTFDKASALHFIPAILIYIYLVHFFLLPPEQKIFVYKNKGIGYEVFMAVTSAAIIISGIVYIVLTTLLHRKHKRDILHQFSFTEKINLDWIQYLIYGIALIWIFVIWGNDNFVFGTAVFFVLFIGYFGIRQVGIFENPIKPITGVETLPSGVPKTSIEDTHQVVNAKDDDDNTSDQSSALSTSTIEDFWDSSNAGKKKYSKSGLSEYAATQLHQKLKQLVESEKIFNQSELTLTELAKRLGTHPNYLSQVINEKEGKNFYDYINTLRTEEFKRLVANPSNQKFTLLGLAYECGFNSKSSFNKYFRKVTGLSPSQYLQKLNIQEAA